jgi:tRNA modification GTPase
VTTPREAETIAAVATPPGEGGVGIVRISGPRSLEIARHTFVPRRGVLSAAPPSHVARHGLVRDPRSGEVVDEVLLLFMRGPASYTGEDVVELQGHGGTLSVGRVLAAVLAAGARPAGPGEFTRRAFLNGKLDLSQAEAVLELVAARSEEAHRAALARLGGGLGGMALGLREALAELLALVESSLDFDGEGQDPPTHALLGQALGELQDSLGRMLATAGRWELLQRGVTVAIVGRPNVGKSSLLNLLVGEERAIVTPVPGTTRDTVRGTLWLGGIALEVVDSAGIREAACPVEEEGIRRARREMASADLVLVVLDASVPLAGEDLRLVQEAGGGAALLLRNKTDLSPRWGPEELLGPWPDATVVDLSCVTGEGLHRLRMALLGRAAGLCPHPGEERLMVNARQRAALEQTAARVEDARTAVAAGCTAEMIASDLRLALDALGELTGETATEEILERIFSRFCIGK